MAYIKDEKAGYDVIKNESQTKRLFKKLGGKQLVFQRAHKNQTESHDEYVLHVVKLPELFSALATEIINNWFEELHDSVTMKLRKEIN